MGINSSKNKKSKRSALPTLAKLVINGIAYDVGARGFGESCPPYHSLEPVNSDIKIKWQISEKMEKLLSENPKTIRWQDKEGMPPVLVTTAGEPIRCVLVKDGKELYDYGDKIYVRRGGGGCSDGNNDQDIIFNEFYVGECVNCVGSSARAVSFSYDKNTGTLKPMYAGYYGYLY